MNTNKLTTPGVKVGAFALMIAMLLPLPAYAGIADPILSTLNGQINGALTQITSIQKQIQSLQQQVLYPLSEINSIRSWSSNLVNLYRGWMASVYNLPLRSAQLPNPANLETVFTIANPAAITNVSVPFVNTYGAIPNSSIAPPPVRQMTDMSDALSQDALKQAIASDAASSSLLQMADTLENNATVAPGTASYISASAYAATLQTLAYQHKLLASQLREEAAALAHESAKVKQSAISAGNLNQTLQQLLTHQ